MEQFTENELKILQSYNQMSRIGYQIYSARSKTGHISRQHVRNVLTGVITADTPTNREIIARANCFLKIISNQMP